MSSLHVIAPSGESDLTPDRPHAVGRGRDCDVVIPDARISRRHLALEPGPGGWTARDISSNGIWVNGTRTSSVPLTGGEVRIRLGATDGPEVVLIPPRPAAASVPAEPDVAELQTMLAGGPAAPSQPAARPGPPQPPTPPRQAPYQQVPHQPPAQQPPTPAPAPAGARRAPLVRTLPTFLWLAAIGFFLGALLALS